MSSDGSFSVDAVLNRIRSHVFHPVDSEGFTVDRVLQKRGIADLDDEDWRVRLLAVRDLVRGGDAAIASIGAALQDQDVQIRYTCATALGVLRAMSAVNDLERLVRNDQDPLVRSAATIALGRIGATESLDALQHCRRHDASKDVRHQANWLSIGSKKVLSPNPSSRRPTGPSTRRRSIN